MEFTFHSGDLALDLAGTVQHRRDDRRDLLTAPDRLARWAVAAGLVTDPPPVSDADLAARMRTWARDNGGVGARLMAGLSAVEHRAQVKKARLDEVDRWVKGAT